MLAVDSDRMVNIADAYSDPRFDRSVDQKAGFLTRAVLCTPIRDKNGCTGVIQIVNKMPTGSFNATDEHMFEIFGTYCANIVNYKNQHDVRKRAESQTAVYRDVVFNRIPYRLVELPWKIPGRGVLPVSPADLAR